MDFLDAEVYGLFRCIKIQVYIKKELRDNFLFYKIVLYERWHECIILQVAHLRYVLIFNNCKSLLRSKHCLACVMIIIDYTCSLPGFYTT